MAVSTTQQRIEYEPLYWEPNGQVYCGHTLEVLRTMPGESVDMVMTSPPYWGLRTYKTEPIIWDDHEPYYYPNLEPCKHEWGDLTAKVTIGRNDLGEYEGKHSKAITPGLDAQKQISTGNFCLKCNAWRGELGLEPTIELYIEHLVLIFNEVKRVLKKTGTCWVNLDDSYGTHASSGSIGQFGIDMRNDSRNARSMKRPRLGLEKSLCLIPQRFAIAMVENDSGDIYELDKGFILWYNNDVKENKTHAIHRPHQWLRSGTQEGNTPHRFDIRVAQERELPTGLQNFVHELQCGSRVLWFLPPSGRRNLRLRKSDIPIDLLPYFHLAQQERWLLRNDICWSKPNPMPESVKDRFTGSWEHLFFFVKNKKYWFEQQLEKYQPSSWERAKYSTGFHDKMNYADEFINVPHYKGDDNFQRMQEIGGRNKRDVWEITTQPYPEAHFAVYPEKLCETPILAGCPSMICKKCGKAREKIYEYEETTRPVLYGDKDDTGVGRYTRGLKQLADNGIRGKLDAGYTDCGCNAGFEPGVVMDIFAGSGTTGAVAKRLGRKYIGIELNPDYYKLHKRRLQAIPMAMELVA